MLHDWLTLFTFGLCFGHVLPFVPLPRNMTHDSTKKNVVFIIIDDLGIRDLVSYQEENQTFYLTPNIDKLADKGILFKNAYSAAPTCSLSRAGIFTGIYPSRLGMFHKSLDRYGFTEERKCFHKYNQRTLPLSACSTTMGIAFQSHGYQTGFIGKWHNNDSPRDHGFGTSIGQNGNGHLNTQFSPYLCNIRYCENKLASPPNMTIDVSDGTFSVDHLTLETIKTMREFKAKDSPFFIVLSHYAVHHPVQSRIEDEMAFEIRRKELNLKKYESKYEKKIYTRTLQSHPTYAGMLKSVDDSVGMVMEELEDLGILEDTIVVLTSDNGGAASSHKLSKYGRTSNFPYDLGKSYLAEGGIRVPLIIAAKGLLAEGIKSEYKSIGIDIFPTLLDLVGVPLMPDDHVDGRSLLPAMNNNSLIRSEPMFWQANFEYFWGGKSEYPTAIQWGDWKLLERFPPVASSSSLPEYNLYNIRIDPGESNDLYDVATCEATMLLQRLKEWQSELFNTTYFQKAMVAYNCTVSDTVDFEKPEISTCLHKTI